MFLRLLIALVALSNCAQNTCPQGWAAKTAFVSCGTAQHASHCPMHKQKESKQDSRDDVKRSLSNVKQAFVIHIAGRDNSYQIFEHRSGSLPMDSFTMTEIFSEPIHRPPIFSSLS